MDILNKTGEEVGGHSVEDIEGGGDGVRELTGEVEAGGNLVMRIVDKAGGEVGDTVERIEGTAAATSRSGNARSERKSKRKMS